MSALPKALLEPNPRLVRRPEVERITGLSRSAIYWRNQHDPAWPKSIRVSANTVAWIESEVLAWVSLQIDRARHTPGAP